MRVHRPGPNAGFPRIGNSGDSWVEREVEKTAVEHIRSVLPISGWAWRVRGSQSKHHRAPFRGMSVCL